MADEYKHQAGEPFVWERSCPSCGLPVSRRPGQIFKCEHCGRRSGPDDPPDDQPQRPGQPDADSK